MVRSNDVASPFHRRRGSSHNNAPSRQGGIEQLYGRRPRDSNSLRRRKKAGLVGGTRVTGRKPYAATPPMYRAAASVAGRMANVGTLAVQSDEDTGTELYCNSVMRTRRRETLCLSRAEADGRTAGAKIATVIAIVAAIFCAALVVTLKPGNVAAANPRTTRGARVNRSSDAQGACSTARC